MASTWSALKIELLETGQNSGTWGTATNVNLGDAVLGEAITGQATVDFASDADVTITLTDSASTQAARNLRLNITESSTGVGSVRNLILGSGCQIEKFYLINNTGTGAKTVKNTSGTGISVPAGKATLVYNNGTNVVDAASYFTSLTLGSALPVASGGTSLSTLTANNVILGNGTSSPLFVAPSSSGNVLTSNGTTWSSSAPAAGGITYTAVKTANYTAVNNDGVQTNTTAGAFTVTLPATPSNGNQVFVVDSFNTWGTNNLTIGRNGSTIEGVAQDLVCDITGVSVQCVYNGTTWDIFAQVGGAGGSVVSGPASSTDNAFTRFDGTTGKLLQNSTATLGDAGEAVFATGTFGASSGGVTTVTAIGNTLSNIVIGDPSTASSSSGIQFKGGSSTTNWVISGNGNVTSGIEITPSTTVNGTTFNAPVVKVTSTGLIAKTTIAVGNATPSTSGAGITFPADQTILGGSTDANTLDDYEQGTWTPTVIGTTTAGTGTYSTQNGQYTKVGNMVTATSYVEWSAHTGTGNMQLGGLPFTTLNAGANLGSVDIGYCHNIALTASNVITAYIGGNSTQLAVEQYPVGGGSSVSVPMDSNGGLIYTVLYLA